MNSIIAEIERAVAAAKAALDRAASPADAEAVRIEYLSRNGLFPALSRRMGEVPPEERRATGTAFNAGRCEIETALEAAKSRLTASAAGEEYARHVGHPRRRIAVSRDQYQRTGRERTQGCAGHAGLGTRAFDRIVLPLP